MLTCQMATFNFSITLILIKLINALIRFSEMKKRAVLLVLVLSIAIPSVLADWFYNSENLITNINIHSEAEVVPLTPSGYIDSATINLTFFPKQYYNQELLKFHTNPEAKADDKQLTFSWKRPEGTIDFLVNADVKTQNSIIKVDRKIKFPIESLPDEIVEYTKPSKTIDAGNEDIIRLASEIVKGEDDLYAAVFKVAEWTKNNIEYNLSTLTADVSQKASWVLENKQGVCDELTSLFIALLRAVGVPARFISGVAYTNSPLFPDNWGAHGWAEVYFPGYGWVPFDVTYGQFGWVDPTHIKFKEAVDSDEPSTYYQWVGRNADLRTKDLDVKANVVEKSGYKIIPLNLEASTLKKSISFGSYNLVEASVENLNDFYYSTELYLSKPKEVKIIGNELVNILLLPGERKKAYWIINVDDSLNKRFSYTFPIIVSTLTNISMETSFTASDNDDYVPFEDVNKVAKLLEEEKQKAYSGNVLLNCLPEKKEFYYYEDAKLNCEIKNTGNVFLENLDICFENKCSKIDLGISQSKNITFDIDKSIGHRESEVTLKNGLVTKTANIDLKVNDDPKIEIENLEFPLNVSRDGNFTVYFSLAKKSQSKPVNVKITFSRNGFEKKWSINELDENEKFILNFEGGQLKYGANEFKIDVNYHDTAGKQYSANRQFSIRQTDANMLQKMYYSLFGGLSRGTAISIISTGAVVFILIIIWTFRRRNVM